MTVVLNKNSFLRWTGNFTAAPFYNVANDDAVSVAVTAPSVDILVLANDTSTFGIDTTSLVITLQDNLVTPATWNPTTRKITYYLPAGVGAGDRAIKYTWKDVNGNVSNEGVVTITITARVTAWRGYAPSYACELSGGERTGNGVYSTLEQYYTDDDTPTGTTKPNDSGDPDYIAPVDDADCSTAESREWDLIYNNASPSCSGGGVAVFSGPSVTALTYGVILYQHADLTNLCVDGYYSDGTNCYQLSGGHGTIFGITSCG